MTTLYITGSTPSGVTTALDRWHSQDRVSLLVVRDDPAAAPAIAWGNCTPGVRLAFVDVWHGLDIDCPWTAADEQARRHYHPDRVLLAGEPEGSAGTWPDVVARRVGGAR